MKEEKQKIKISALKGLAIEKIENALDEETYTTDLTDQFLNELTTMVKLGEPINIGINGEVGSGKTCLGLALTDLINKLYGKKMSLKQIASDQSDLLDMLLERDRGYECIHVDELNPLLKTGYDATTFQALLEWYSDICAQKHVARINCNPSTMADRNITINLNIIGTDKQKKLTAATISYHFENPQQTGNIPVGYILINVEKVIKKEWYQNYLKRKFARMDLILKHGIRDTRELHFAKTILQTYQKLKPICNRIQLTSGKIDAIMEDVNRENKQFHSILTQIMLSDKIKGILSLEQERQKSNELIRKIKEKEKKTEQTLQRLKEEEQINQTFEEIVKEKERRLEELVKLKTEYDKIWQD